MQFIRLDWDSNILWARDISAHHDINIDGDGDIDVLSSAEEFIDHHGLDIPTKNHYIRVLSPEGESEQTMSFLSVRLVHVAQRAQLSQHFFI